MSYSFDLYANPQQVDQFVDNHPNGSLLQQSSWSQIKDNWGHRIVAVTENDQIVASALVLVKKMPLGYKLYYLPRGPILDFSNHELVKFFFTELGKVAKKDKAICIKFDPLVVHDVRQPGELTGYDTLDDTTKYLKSIGMKHHGYNLKMSEASQPRTLAVIHFEDITQMKPKLNYYLKHALNLGLEVTRVGREGVKTFAQLEAKTGQRKNISLRNEDYFRKLMEVYDDQALITLASLNIPKAIVTAQQNLDKIRKQLERPTLSENQAKDLKIKEGVNEKNLNELLAQQKEYGDHPWVSGGLIIRSNHLAEFLYAGMDENFAAIRSNNTYYEALKWAQENGCRICDLGGVEGTIDDGLAISKSLYQPRFESYIGEFDYPLMPLRYQLFTKALPLAKSFMYRKAQKQREKEQD